MTNPIPFFENNWPLWYTDSPFSSNTIQRVFLAWFPASFVCCTLLVWFSATLEYNSHLILSGDQISWLAILGENLIYLAVTALFLAPFLFSITLVCSLVILTMNRLTGFLLPPSICGLLATGLNPIPIAIYAALRSLDSPEDWISQTTITACTITQLVSNTSVIWITWRKLPRRQPYPLRYGVQTGLIGISIASLFLLAISLQPLILTLFLGIFTMFLPAYGAAYIIWSLKEKIFPRKSQRDSFLQDVRQGGSPSRSTGGSP